jgi:peptide/nickel transport system ATP-binding protein
MSVLLQVCDFSLWIEDKRILDSISLSVSEGEIVAVVGESGSGKSMLAKSILRLNREKGIREERMREEGRILFEGTDISRFNDRQMALIRGNKTGMIFQEPLTYLNPVLRMKGQLTEPLVKHRGLRKNEAALCMKSLLGSFDIKNPEKYMEHFPHELSGGLAQRGMIAMASSCKPRLIIADEATSSLDVITQTSIVNILRDMARLNETSLIFITHDLKLAAKIADRAVIMSKGSIVEEGSIRQVFDNPRSDAAKLLLKAVAGCESESQCCKSSIAYDNPPVLKINNLSKYYKNGQNSSFKAVDNISLDMYKGEVLGLLGESGSGKTTLARLVTRILKPDSGDILYKEREVLGLKDYPKQVQMVFQDPLGALDPRMRVKDIVAEGLDIFKSYTSREERTLKVRSAIEKVGLDISFETRFPHQLCGGQRQRVGIARSLVMEPEILVCDEPTSYLDAVSKAQILNLFRKLKEDMKLAYLFITHDIGTLASICDRIAVMFQGRIVETGRCEDILKNPLHPYTRMLLSAAYNKKGEALDCPVEVLNSGVEEYDMGCVFCHRCYAAKDECFREKQGLLCAGDMHYVACCRCESVAIK